MKEFIKKIISYFTIIDEVLKANIFLKRELREFRIVLFNVIFNQDDFVNEMKKIYYIHCTTKDNVKKEHYYKINIALLRSMHLNELNSNEYDLLKKALDNRYAYHKKKITKSSMVNINTKNNPYFDYFIKSKENKT